MTSPAFFPSILVLHAAHTAEVTFAEYLLRALLSLGGLGGIGAISFSVLRVVGVTRSKIVGREGDDEP